MTPEEQSLKDADRLKKDLFQWLIKEVDLTNLDHALS